MSVDVGKAVGYLDLDISGFTSGINEANESINTFRDNSNSASDRFSALGSTLTSVGGSLTKFVTVPLAGVGAAAIAAGSSFETAFDNMSVSIGATAKEADGLKEVMKNVFSQGFGQDFDDVATSIGEVRKQIKNLSNEELEDVTIKAIAFRDTFGYEVPESVRAANAMIKNFGITAGEAFDLMAKGAQEGLDFSGELIDNINEYSVQFKKLGLTAEDMFSIFESGSKNGAWNLDKIGDAVKEFSIRAIDGSKTTIDGFTKLGMNVDEMAKKFAKGGEEARNAFFDVAKAISEVEDPVEQSIIGVDLFGTMWEDLGPDVITQLAGIKDATYDASGAMEDLISKKYDNLSSQLSVLKNNLKLLAVSFGEILLPAIIPIVEKITNFIKRLSELDVNTRKIITIIGLLVAAIGPLMMIVRNVLSFIATMKTALSTLGIAISSIASPIGIVIAAVAALVLAWETDFGGMRDKTEEIMGSIKDIITSIVEAIKYAWDNNIGGMRTIVETVFAAIELVFETALNVISGIFEMFAGIFTGDWKRFWNGLKTVLKSILSAIKKIIQGVFDWISGGIKKAIEKLKSLGGKSAETQAERKSGNKTGGNKRKVKGYANGLEYVPYDGFPAILHKGERVLTKTEADSYNKGTSGATYQFTFNSPQELSPAEQTRAFKKTMNEILFDM